MAKIGSWKWEGKQKIQRSLDESHELDVVEALLEKAGVFEDSRSDTIILIRTKKNG